MVHFSTLLTVVPFVAAFPQMSEVGDLLQKRTQPPARAPLFLSNRPNTGTGQTTTEFSATDQLVSVTGTHAYKAPGATDLRGECPGLNAAANHGYLPRTGLVTIADTITGLNAAYNMSPDLALFLAVVSVGLGGDPITETWSIGGPFKSTLGQSTGILEFHNRYEGDSSIIRGDAYLNGGQVGVFQERSWRHLYSLGSPYTLDKIAAQSDYVTRWSKLNNPYYFSAPFSGAVAPAAHNFVINFMSNHSAEAPDGVLPYEIIAEFFGVTGNPSSGFVQTRGTERIPAQWYKRNAATQYNLAGVVGDVVVDNAMYPGILEFGGNTGKVNTFTGLDLSDLTGGVYNAKNLFEGNNLSCFLLQASLAGMSDDADAALGAVGSVLGWATSKIAPLEKKLACPQLKAFNNTAFNQFPGASYTGSN